MGYLCRYIFYINIDMTKGYIVFFMLWAGLFGFSACGELFEYHPYEGKISGKTDIVAGNVRRLEEFGRGRKRFRFAFITDTQRWYDDTEKAVRHINARGDIDFVVHGGDFTDFGATNEFEWMRDELERLAMPYVTVIGNHDCVGRGEHIYAKMFGVSNYGFTVGNTRFVCLNTIALEYDYSNPVPDFGFLRREAQLLDSINACHSDSITHTVVVMHSRPGDEQFNNNVSEVFDYYVSHFPGMGSGDPVFDGNGAFPAGSKKNSFCLNGHNHRFEVKDIFSNGILYYGCANINKHQYFVFTIDEEGYEFERVDF